MKHSLYSAPDEEYSNHILLCKEIFERLFPIFLSATKRITGRTDENIIYNSFGKMIFYHDLGKLTRRWQENVGKNKPLPSHAPVGASYLWKTLPEGIKEPISFAVTIHHTDRGLLGDNIERPDVQAILEGIIDYNGNIVWHDEAYNLNNELFPENAKILTVNDLKEMARGLRVWAKGDSLLVQHKRRLQALLCHHILKLCDISAATKRKDYQEDVDKDYYGGWLMVESIKEYVENKIKIF